MDETASVMLVVFLCVAAYFIGGVVEAVSWRADCAHIGYHLSDGKRFKCEALDKK